jgi:hypothetical protein
MRNMSFSMTTEAYRAGIKTVTRRLGWDFLVVDEIFMGVEKCQGLKKGEHVVRMHPARTISTFWEPLEMIIWYPNDGREECVLEGFPGMTGFEFVDMFMKANCCAADELVNRIVFEHIMPPTPATWPEGWA